LFVTAELREEKRGHNHQGRAHAVTVGRIGVEQVHTFILQRRLYVLLYDRDRSVEAVFQAGQPGLLPARKNILQHDALVGREPLPFGQRLDQMKDVVLGVEHQQGRVHGFFNLYVAPHCQVHNRGRNVTGMDGVIPGQ